MNSDTPDGQMDFTTLSVQIWHGRYIVLSSRVWNDKDGWRVDENDNIQKSLDALKVRSFQPVCSGMS